jgi:two-component system, chemotaxis family, sensor kinase CheA
MPVISGKSFSMALRLAAGFGFVMLLVLAIAVDGALTLGDVSGHLNRIVDINNRRTGLANELLESIDSMAIEARTIALLTDIGAIDKERKAFERSATRYADVQRTLAAALAVDDPADPARAMFARISANSAATLPDLRKAVRQGVEGSNFEATQTLMNDVRPAEATWRGNVADFLALQQARTAASVADAHASRRQAYALSGLLVASAIVSGSLVAWWVIRNNLRMVRVIAEQNATLERRVEDRTAQLARKTGDINAMLQNMKLGVCTIIEGNRIHPEYSRHLVELTQREVLAGEPLIECLFGDSDFGADQKDQLDAALAAIVGADPMMFDFNAHLLVREMRLAGAAGDVRIVQLDWNPIVGADGQVEKLLLILQDVTALRALEHQSGEQRVQLEVIASVLKVPEPKFIEFVTTARASLAACRAAMAGDARPDEAALTQLFRHVHTVKGNARTCGFGLIADAAHAAEQGYDHLRKDPAAAWDRARALAELEAVDAAVTRYAATSEDTLGRRSRPADAMDARGVFLSPAQLGELQAAVSDAIRATQSPDASGAATMSRVASLVGSLGLPPLRRVVAEAMAGAPALAAELGKTAPAFEVLGTAMALRPAFARTLRDCLMHVVRNAIDHGIEPPDERARCGKSAQPLLRFRCERDGGGGRLSIADDGRGLALDRLREKGRACGLIDEGAPAAAVAELIFHSGLSTATAVTQVSGRGVGMDAVRSFLREHGGDARIVLREVAPQARGYASFELVLEIPAEACVF